MSARSHKRPKTGRNKRRSLERQLQKGKIDKALAPHILLYQIKYQLNKAQYSALYKTLPTEVREYIEGYPLPKVYRQLRSIGGTFVEDYLHKELEWYESDLAKYSSEINSFIKLEGHFENALLQANYDTCEKILDQIEREICVSHWSIEQRLILSEYQFGFKKNKETLSEIVREDNQQIVNIFAHYQSTRIERNLSHFNYEEIFGKFLSAHDDAKARKYLQTKLNFFKEVDQYNLGFILSFDNNASIIDRYHSFVNVAIALVSKKSSGAAIIEKLYESILSLRKSINDSRLQNILLCGGKIELEAITNSDIQFICLLDLYTKGHYEECIRHGIKFLKENPTNFDAYEIVSKSFINTQRTLENPFPVDSIAGKSLESIYHIILKDEKTDEALANGHKTFNSLGLRGWTYKFFAYFNNEHQLREADYNYFKYAFLNSQYLNPSLAIFFDDKSLGIRYLDALKEKCKSELTCQFWIDILHRLSGKNVPLRTQSFRENLYLAKVKSNLGLYEDALSEYNRIAIDKTFEQELGIFHNYEEVLVGVLICLIQLGRYNEALDLVTQNVIENHNLIHKIGFSGILDAINRCDAEEIMKNISAAIFLHQYNQGLNDIWIAYDNFLSAYNLDFPHQLENIASNFPHKKVVYFLKHVCRQEVYDSSFMFENQDDLDNERIEVCLLLTKIDPENSANYIDEISAISRNILIRKGIKQIDESKIYADVVGMRRTLEKDLRESFNRSLELMAIPIDQITKLSLQDTGKVVVPYYGKSKDSTKIEFQKENIRITSYKRYELFADMFYRIRDVFVSSAEYGIETYLSMRIRHGTLLGEIRSVFEGHHLITKKDSGSGRYEENSYWLNKLRFQNAKARADFSQRLSIFSFRIDEISEDLKNKKLQIHTEKKQTSGLFNYSYHIDSDLLELFRDRIGGIEEYDEFVDTIVDEMWGRTELNLSTIRDYILKTVTPEILKELTQLAKDADSVVDKTESHDYNEFIRTLTDCQTHVMVEFEKISLWFRRTNSKTINEFHFHLPIDASLATIKRIFPAYSLFVPEIINNSQTRFDGEYFTQFSDLIQILLHNVTKHSQLDTTALHCSILVSEVDSFLTIETINNVADSVNLEQLNQRINETKELLSQDHDHDAIKKEDRSGYLKIRKILKSGLHRNNYKITLSNIDDTRIFRSVIKFEIDNLEKKEKE
jgi:hypothetical protein